MKLSLEAVTYVGSNLNAFTNKEGVDKVYYDVSFGKDGSIITFPCTKELYYQIEKLDLYTDVNATLELVDNKKFGMKVNLFAVQPALVDSKKPT